MNKSTNTKENGFEKHIVDYLVNNNGYVLRTSQDYNNVSCVDCKLLFQFLETTQPILAPHMLYLFETESITIALSSIPSKLKIE